MALHVVNEARRCLNCKVPQCRKGCPINTPIPDMIQLFLQNQLEAAGEMLFLNNPDRKSTRLNSSHPSSSRMPSSA